MHEEISEIPLKQSSSRSYESNNTHNNNLQVAEQISRRIAKNDLQNASHLQAEIPDETISHFEAKNLDSQNETVTRFALRTKHRQSFCETSNLTYDGWDFRVAQN